MRKAGREGGFTLIEVMVTMGIIALLAAIAIFSTAQSRYEREMDRFAVAIMNAMKEARSRAVKTGRRYSVQFTSRSVQWCEDQCLPTPQPNKEYGERYWSSDKGAKAVKYVAVADFNLPAMPPTTPIISHEIYFYSDGTADGDPSTPTRDGFTVYLQHASKQMLKFRVVILPLSGNIRKFTSWGD